MTVVVGDPRLEMHVDIVKMVASAVEACVNGASAAAAPPAPFAADATVSTHPSQHWT